MTPDELNAARTRLGAMWKLDRPLHAAEMGRILRIPGRDPGAKVREYERGTRRIPGPLTAAVDMMLAGALPPDGLKALDPT